MKYLFVILMFSSSTIAMNTLHAAPLITDAVQIGCGWSDLVYAELEKQLPQKSRNNISIRSKGRESGRRLYFFSDESWFLSLEYFSKVNTEQDISCIVKKGPGSQSEEALQFILESYPDWKWGVQPKSWP